MSHIPPPNGSAPPPPYYNYGHHPPPPHPQSTPYAYVPLPVVMPPFPHHPPPPENPTYITNYYVSPNQPVQPPPYPVAEPLQIYPPVTPQGGDTVRVADEIIDWIPATPLTANNFSARAVVGGHEGWDGSPLWVIRAHHSGDLIPGKLAVKHRAAFIPHAGRELPVHNFEILCAPPNTVRWLPASNGQVPLGAIPAGNTLRGEPLYIGRAKHMFSQTPGKVHPSHRCCYISFGGNEVSYKNYDVLCKIVG